jgi:hypothetical protein
VDFPGLASHPELQGRDLVERDDGPIAEHGFMLLARWQDVDASGKGNTRGQNRRARRIDASSTEARADGKRWVNDGEHG